MSAALDITLEAVAAPIINALMHFIWQGSLVALLLGAVIVLLRPRRAEVRYRLACGALVLMVALPLLTALRYESDENTLGEPAVASTSVAADTDTAPARNSTKSTIQQLARRVPVDQATSGLAGSLLREVARRAGTSETTRWILLAWLGGVGLISMLHLGGWLRVQQLRRLQIEAVAPAWQDRADVLCRALGISRAVTVLRSAAVEVPAVIGWLRPVVLIPASALSGLPVQQLECILAHELAHIRRRDYLVNLLQTCAETLLFYHPAVWWVSQQIRHERENCCDDLAVRLTGNRVLYARALVDLEELRQPLPRLALGADGGSMLRRVERLIGGPDMSLPLNRNLLAGTLIALLIVAGGSVLALAAQTQLGEVAALAGGSSSVGEVLSGRWFAEREDDGLYLELRQRSKREGRRHDSWNTTLRVPEADFNGLAFTDDAEFRLDREAGTFIFRGDFEGSRDKAEGTGNFTFTADSGYLAELEDLGTKRVGDVEMMVLAAENLEVKTVEKMRKLGYGPFDDDELVTMAIFSVTPEFVAEMADLGFDHIPLDELVAMRVHDVDREFVEALNDAGVDIDDADDLVALSVHDVDPEYIASLRKEFGDDVDMDDIMAFKIHDVDPDFVASVRKEFGDDVDIHEVMAMKIHGISSEYIASVRKEFGDDVDAEEILAMKIHGVDSSYLESVRRLGYDLDTDELLAWRIHRVTADFIEELAELGYKNVEADDLVALRIHGATPKWIKHLHDKGLENLDVDDLIKLRISGVEL